LLNLDESTRKALSLRQFGQYRNPAFYHLVELYSDICIQWEQYVYPAAEFDESEFFTLFYLLPYR
jgi:hypothetical protein